MSTQNVYPADIRTSMSFRYCGSLKCVGSTVTPWLPLYTAVLTATTRDVYPAALRTSLRYYDSVKYDGSTVTHLGYHSIQ